MQILSIVDFFVCIVNTCTRYYSMHDAVDNYLESCGANRPSIGGEETILAHRQITADWRLIAYMNCPRRNCPGWIVSWKGLLVTC